MHSARTVRTHRRERIHPRALRRRTQHLDPLGGEGRVERIGELPGPIPDQIPDAARPLSQAPGELPGHLHRPLPRRMRRDPEDVHHPTPHIHDKEHVHPLQVRQIHVEKVAGQKGLGVSARERAPALSRERRGAGGSLRASMIRRVVEAPTRSPSRRNSPWILV